MLYRMQWFRAHDLVRWIHDHEDAQKVALECVLGWFEDIGPSDTTEICVDIHEAYPIDPEDSTYEIPAEDMFKITLEVCDDVITSLWLGNEGG